jgi:hypothetical protein
MMNRRRIRRWLRKHSLFGTYLDYELAVIAFIFGCGSYFWYSLHGGKGIPWVFISAWTFGALALLGGYVVGMQE